jgi:hypothetical protein
LRAGGWSLDLSIAASRLVAVIIFTLRLDYDLDHSVCVIILLLAILDYDNFILLWRNASACRTPAIHFGFEVLRLPLRKLLT